MFSWAMGSERRSSAKKTINCFILFLTHVLVVRVSGLKLLQVSIPPLKLTGQSARLACLYDLQGETLYSIKWYKGGREFFRYVQRDQPPIQVFPVDGVTVDKSLSDQYQVTLTQLTIASAGRYKCEVSVDAPSFQTAFNVVEMNIVVLPESGPRITTRGHQFNSNIYSSSSSSAVSPPGGRHERVKNGDHRSYYTYYRPGDDDEIQVNCTSNRSRPAAALHWYVNGIKVKSDYLIEYAPFGDGNVKLETSVLGLRWKLPSEPSADVLVLNCTAAIESVYWSSTALTLNPEPGQVGKSRPMLMYHESHLSSKATEKQQTIWAFLLAIGSLVLAV